MAEEELVESPARATARLGGAKADFVGSLGRKVAECNDLIRELESSPSKDGARSQLQRKLAALEVGARFLRFEKLTHSLQDLSRMLQGNQDAAVDFRVLGRSVLALPTLVWNDEAPRTSSPSVDATLVAALVLGGADLTEMMQREAFSRRRFSCEQTTDSEEAETLARSYAPDIIVVDADVPCAFEFASKLFDDPWSEPVPIIVVGTFDIEGDRAQYTKLGVTKTLIKPILRTTLVVACAQALDLREGRTVQLTASQVSLEELGDKIANEVRRSLVDVIDLKQRREWVSRSDEVWGVFLGAIARARDVISRSTSGSVRYPRTQTDSVTVVSSLLEESSALMSVRAGPEGAVDVSLEGVRVLIADDDPSVTWFIADLLRTAGCEVHETTDGQEAFELACRVHPHLILADIVMPGQDGFALCRKLRRDPVLRHVPVILLSWKDDLLQRVRELGANASGYLRKESDSAAILARVREALIPRMKIMARLSAEDAAYGRIDGIGTLGLLQAVQTIRPNSRISIQDASFLYELELREGVLIRATRIAPDGNMECGLSALQALLGVSAARFVVLAADNELESEFVAGERGEAFAPYLVLARAALSLCTGSRIAHIEGIEFDEHIIEDYLKATPDPARHILKRLVRGDSARRLLVTGEVAPGMLEDVLADVAARGGVLAIRNNVGDDLLDAALHEARAIQDGAQRRVTRSLPEPVQGSLTMHPPVTEPSAEPTKEALREAATDWVGMQTLASDAPTLDSCPDEPSPPPKGAQESVIETAAPVIEPDVESSSPTSRGELDTNWLDAAEPSSKVANAQSILIPKAVVAELKEGPLPKSKMSQASVVFLLAMIAVGLGTLGFKTLATHPTPRTTEPFTVRTPERATISTLRVDGTTELVPCTLASNQGLIALNSPPDAPIRIDGTIRPRGPHGTIALPSGTHEVRVGVMGGERTASVEVRGCATTRVTWE